MALVMLEVKGAGGIESCLPWHVLILCGLVVPVKTYATYETTSKPSKVWEEKEVPAISRSVVEVDSEGLDLSSWLHADKQSLRQIIYQDPY
jgi:hypothetical protein